MKLDSRFAWAILPLAFLFGLWELLVRTGALSALFFPPPSVLAGTGWDMTRQGELLNQIGTTLARFGAGFMLGAAAGLLLGLLMGGSKTVRHAVEPLVSALNATPKLTLLPLLMLFLGVGEVARTVLIALSAFLVLAIHVVDAVRGIPAAYVEMAANYGARPLDLLRRVYFPASLPQVFTGVRLAIGRALVITLSAELVGASDGLGGMIWLAWQTFAPERLYVGVIVSAALGAVLHGGLLILERFLVPWRVQPGRA
jgi:ABC-type nitrate/sulfonate/bicarbonate transport system permease component